MKRKVLKIIGVTALCVILAVVALLAFVTITEYRPDETESLAIDGESSSSPAVGDSIDLMIWNIGYGALGETADFFMDGGEEVRSSDEVTVEANLVGISETILECDPDILMLQEVDRDSRRSYHIDEKASLFSQLEGSTDVIAESSFAYNFKTLFVPYPWPPIGKVQSGILTTTSYDISESTRISLPCPFKWPVSTVNLKRCLDVTRIPVEGSDAELVIINLHLEAYDDGSGKVAQTNQLKELLEEEYEKGNYVIAAGDFNQTFSNTDVSAYPAENATDWVPGSINTEDMEDHFSWLMDSENPTCRSLATPLAGSDPDNFTYYVIDGCIVSDNLTVNSMETLNCGFVNSDHNPVTLSVTLQ